MIAAGNHGLHRAQISQPLEKVEIQAHRVLWRIRGIKDITAEQQRVYLLTAQRFYEPVKKSGMLRQAVTLDESSAQMPVCGVEDAHAVE